MKQFKFILLMVLSVLFLVACEESSNKSEFLSEDFVDTTVEYHNKLNTLFSEIAKIDKEDEINKHKHFDEVMEYSRLTNEYAKLDFGELNNHEEEVFNSIVDYHEISSSLLLMTVNIFDGNAVYSAEEYKNKYEEIKEATSKKDEIFKKYNIY